MNTNDVLACASEGGGTADEERARRRRRAMSRVPPAAARFAARHLGSVNELHVLINCVRERERWWDAAAVAAALGMSESAALRALEQLAQRNLLDVRVSGAVRYRFATATPQLEEGALALTAAYWTDPLAVTQYVAVAARRGLRDFADAFKIRHDDDR